MRENFCWWDTRGYRAFTITTGIQIVVCDQLKMGRPLQRALSLMGALVQWSSLSRSTIRKRSWSLLRCVMREAGIFFSFLITLSGVWNYSEFIHFCDPTILGLKEFHIFQQNCYLTPNRAKIARNMNISVTDEKVRTERSLKLLPIVAWVNEKSVEGGLLTRTPFRAQI